MILYGIMPPLYYLLFNAADDDSNDGGGDAVANVGRASAGPFESCTNETSGEEGRCMFAMVG